MKVLLTGLLFFCFTALPAAASAVVCRPTEPDMLGPFYKPGAPIRSTVGTGYLLSGTVMSSGNCVPLEGARVEFWLAGPDGEYADSYRAVIITDTKGSYRFGSNFPPPYYGRPPHIHIRVTMKGFRALVTQHYPAKGQTQGNFDLVLVPDK